MRLKQLQYLPIIYITTLAILLVIPLGDTHIEQIEVSGFRGDYIVHCIVYIPWMLLGKLLFLEKYNILKWFITGVTYVAVMEFAQYLIPYRGYNTYDLIAGVIGVLISLFIMVIIHSINSSSK